jgi:hypothetical protein
MFVWDRIPEDKLPFASIVTDDDHCLECDAILSSLEDIDDEVDAYGIDFVKNKEVLAARQYAVYSTPALVYFRRKVPIFYDGDLHDSDKVSKHNMS